MLDHTHINIFVHILNFSLKESPKSAIAGSNDLYFKRLFKICIVKLPSRNVCVNLYSPYTE